MRKTLVFAALAGASLSVLHCSSSGTPHLDLPDAGPSTTTPTTKTSKTSKTPPSTTTSTKPTTVKTAPDAGAKATTPGASCQTLSTCCSKLTNSTQQKSCLQTAGKANEAVCTAAEKTFACDSLASAPPTRGPSCKDLTDGALYCGNDGPGGDPATLYLCTGTTISIQRICSNGCTINSGVDDACAAGGTTTPGANASCKGLSGDYCGTDAVSGNADTLYTCANDTIANTTICPNGCNTNPDATLNDTCADAPTTTTVSCEGLPDEAFCGTDLGGDPTMLYTCSGGTVASTKQCTNGCTISAPSVSDFCTGTTADCTFEDDGDYCGTNGVEGDPDTLYTCTNGQVQSNPTVCTFGCIASDIKGFDQCNGSGH